MAHCWICLSLLLFVLGFGTLITGAKLRRYGMQKLRVIEEAGAFLGRLSAAWN